jgi:hypothetical protein
VKVKGNTSWNLTYQKYCPNSTLAGEIMSYSGGKMSILEAKEKNFPLKILARIYRRHGKGNQ